MKVAAIQMCSSQCVSENLEMAGVLIREAATQGAKLIVLPEMFASIGLKLSDTHMAEKMGSGLIQEFLSAQAREHKVWIVGGTIPIVGEEHAGKVSAASLVFDDSGKNVAHYDKIHLFDVVLSETEAYKESDTAYPGNKVVVVDTPFGKLGLAVCYDVRFPELFICLAQQGAEIIVLPAAFTAQTGKLHWELLTRARAVDTASYVIAAAQGGLHSDGRQTYGHSLIVDPVGAIVSEVPGDQPDVVYATLDLAKVHVQRKKIPVSDHRRISINEGALVR